MRISKLATEKPLIVILFTVFVLIVGTMGTVLIPKELNPEISEPVVNVRVEYIGATAGELESEVVRKIEEYTKNIEGIKKIHAWCVNSLANVSITFHENIDINKAKLEVRNGVNDAIAHMPSGIETPVISTRALSDDPFMMVAIYGKITDYVKLREIAEKLKHPLENIKGVGKINIVGGFEREIRISLDPLKISMYKIPLNTFAEHLKNMNADYPGGKLKIKGKNYAMRISGRFKTLAELKNTVIAVRKLEGDTSGRPRIIRLSDIAEVAFAIEDNYSIARINSHAGIMLHVIKKKQTGTLVVSDAVKQRLNLLNIKTLKPLGLKYRVVFDQSLYVLNDQRELRDNLWQGIAAIFIILWIGMGFRGALIASLGMPFCVIITIGTLYFTGNTLNGLTQFGLIIVMGMIVDGAIVTIEAIHSNQEKGEQNKEAVLSSLSDVGSGVLSSVLTTMAAFAPLLFMGGLLGKYMAEIPKSVLFALAASIAFDHIIIPVIASKYMKPSVKKQNKKHRFTMLYIRLIDSSSHNKLKVMLLTVIIFSVGIYLFNSLPKELFPASDAGVVNIEIKLSPVSSIESTDKICTRIEKGILEKYLKLGIIKNYISITGGFDSAGANPDVSFERRAKILIEMVEPEKRRGFRSTTLQNIIRDFVSNIAGTDIEVNVPNAGVGVGEPVNLLIKGDDIRVLKSIAKEIKRLIRKKVRGIINLKDNYGTGLPGVSISINREASGIHGFSVKDIASVLSTYYNGFEVTKYYMGDKELKVRIKIGRKNAGDIRDIDKIYIYKASTDKMIHLKELVNVKMKGISGLIARDNLEKAISITSKVEGRSSVDVMADVVKVLKGFPLPNGYTISFAGESEEMDEGFRNLSFAFIGGLVLMYIIIVLQLKSFLQPVSILITIILSIPGVAFGLLISGSKVGFMAFFGIVALAGVVVNDAIVLVTTINSYRERGMSRDEAIKTASKSRIRPILLTTFTTIAGLVPLAFAFGGEFSRHWVPMSWAIIGGLLFATFQTLIAVPVVYSLLEDMKIFLKSKAVLIISFFRKGP